MAARDRMHLFGVRHHGPGCARSLVRALDAVDPEIVCIEGPPEAEPLLRFAADPSMVPPVALLFYHEKHPGASVFYPFAEYSPEWQAIRWALANDREVRFIDLPEAWNLAQIVEEREQAEADEAAREEAEEAALALDDDEGDLYGEAMEAEPAEDVRETEPGPALEDPFASGTAPTSLIEFGEPVSEDERVASLIARDPIGVLAQLAGHDDGDAWWSELVEQQAHAPEVFEAIESAMTALREASEGKLPEILTRAMERHLEREARREAHMRVSVKKALRESEGPVAVVTGAWHVPALRAKSKASDDRALLKGAPRVKVAVTWVPWTNARLTRWSGYGAGIASPGWYEHLWAHSDGDDPGGQGLASSWAVRTARLLRERGDTVSTANVIEATRLSTALAAVRAVSTPSLRDINDAVVATMLGGQPLMFGSISDALFVGDSVGEVGENAPRNPLEVDLRRQQKRVRLKPTGLKKELSLDLRSQSGRARSTLLHRLQLLGVPWGVVTGAGRSRGTFRENWVLQWDPEFAVRLAEALVYGTTVERAGAVFATEEAGKSTNLAELSTLVRQCLNADLQAAAETCIARLQQVASSQDEIVASMEAVPALVDVLRYGEARDTPVEPLRLLVASLAAQVSSGLVYACRNLSDDYLARMRAAIQAFDRAVSVYDDDPISVAWNRSLGVLERDLNAMPMLRGFAARRLYDRGLAEADATAAAISFALSPTVEPAEASDWLEGFLNEEGQVLLFDEALRGLIDAWVAELSEDGFRGVLPMLRRAFSSLGRGQRQQLMNHFVRARGPQVQGPVIDEDPAAAAVFERALPLLTLMLGWSSDD